MVRFQLDDVNIDEDGGLTLNSTKVFIKKGRRKKSLGLNILSHSDIT